MRRVRTAALLVLAALLLPGCRTHEARFDKDAELQPLSRPPSRLVAATRTLISRPAARASALPPEALATLTDAAAVSFLAAKDPASLALARRYADALLRTRVRRGGLTGFPAKNHPRRPSAAATAGATIALVQAFRATRDPRYAAAVRAGVTAITSPKLGWGPAPGGAAIRDVLPPRQRLVSTTALAFTALDQAGIVVRTGSRVSANAALGALLRAQTGIGRWAVDIGGRPSPIGLTDWGLTLDAVTGSSRTRAQAITGGGVPAIFHLAFDRHGRPLGTPAVRADPSGVALALISFAQYSDYSYATRTFPGVLAALRPDGTVALALPTDATAQAYFALAFAIWQLRLSQQDA